MIPEKSVTPQSGGLPSATCSAWVEVWTRDLSSDDPDEQEVSGVPPEGSICVVDFGNAFGGMEYHSTYNKEDGSGLSARYQVAKFEGGKFRIETVAYECGMTGEKIEIDHWWADRFFILRNV